MEWRVNFALLLVDGEKFWWRWASWLSIFRSVESMIFALNTLFSCPGCQNNRRKSGNSFLFPFLIVSFFFPWDLSLFLQEEAWAFGNRSCTLEFEGRRNFERSRSSKVSDYGQICIFGSFLQVSIARKLQFRFFFLRALGNSVCFSPQFVLLSEDSQIYFGVSQLFFLAPTTFDHWRFPSDGLRGIVLGFFQWVSLQWDSVNFCGCGRPRKVRERKRERDKKKKQGWVFPRGFSSFFFHRDFIMENRLFSTSTHKNFAVEFVPRAEFHPAQKFTLASLFFDLQCCHVVLNVSSTLTNSKVSHFPPLSSSHKSMSAEFKNLQNSILKSEKFRHSSKTFHFPRFSNAKNDLAISDKSHESRFEEKFKYSTI